MITVVGLSHKSAPIEVRERLAFAKDALPALFDKLRAAGVGESVVLSTCNRVEVYAAPIGRAPSANDLEATARAAFEVLSELGGRGVEPHLVRAAGRDAVRHLFRVAASLDSLVVGEPQILGQLKDAIDASRAEKALGPSLGHAMQRAVRVGKRVRTETQIGAGQVSVSSVAVDLARQIFGELDGRVALLVGAGEMAEAAAKLLVKAGARLIVVNRSPERAANLAREVGGDPRVWAELERSIVEADIVVSSTSSPGYVVTRELVKGARKARRGRSLFLIDIAVPRDVEPAVNELDNVYLYDVDDLSQIVAQSLDGRASEAARAAAIVDEEAKGFEAWTLEQSMTPVIVGLRARTRAVLAAEVERSLSGKLRHLGQLEREALGLLVDAATNKLLHAPVTRLRAAAAEDRATDLVEALRDLFDLPERDAEARAAGPSPRADADDARDGDPRFDA
ncbi:MAG TPA: glutamyl-tRNA reductase [Byssovorax sp.]